MTDIPDGATANCEVYFCHLAKEDLLKQERDALGPSSAAAQVLAEAKTHNGPVKFYRHNQSIIIEKLPNGVGD